jgi:hypothetical protein
MVVGPKIGISNETDGSFETTGCCAISLSSRDRLAVIVVAVLLEFAFVAVEATLAVVKTVLTLPFGMLLLLLLTGMVAAVAVTVLRVVVGEVVVGVVVAVVTMLGLTGADRGVALGCRKDKRNPPPPPLAALTTLDTSDK